MATSRLINRNVTAARGRTSMRLEPELWDALEEICRRERVTIGEIVRRIEGTLARANDPGGRTSAVRVFVLRYFREAESSAGHAAAGNGVAASENLAAPIAEANRALPSA